MATKNKIGFIDSILNVIKKNWYLLVIGVLGVVILAITYVHGGKLAGLVDLLSRLSQNYKKQIKTIDKLAQKKSIDDKKSSIKNRKKIKQIEDNEAARTLQVEKEKEKTVENLKKKKSKELAKKIKDDFKI